LLGRRAGDAIPGDVLDYNIKANNNAMQDKKNKNERVIVYIDGFNLYFGMRAAGPPGNFTGVLQTHCGS
jgi:hypothetical protein